MRLRSLVVAAIAVCLAWAGSALAQGEKSEARSPDGALARLLAEAREGCTHPEQDRLVRVLCSGRIRIGVREYYPLFATRQGAIRQGYEIDVAEAIAAKLGVQVEFTRVNAATRLPLLAEDRIDLVIATMGHNTLRDGQVRFVRPHYYRSETIVVGPRDVALAGWAAIRGRTVCATVGNGSNAELVSHDARLMLFDEAGVLPDRLQDGTCQLAAQDDSFFAEYFSNPQFGQSFAPKFGFAQVPWGMAVARTGSARLARALDLMSQIFHRGGVFLELARKNGVASAFLRQQNAVWQQPQCDTDTGSTNPACVLPPLDGELQPTPFARRVSSLEAWIQAHTGAEILLPMLKTEPAWVLFLGGIAHSLILIAGALTTTLVFALALGAAQASSSRLFRWPARAATLVLQSSPIVLTLVIAAAVARALFAFSDAVAVGSAVVALGLVNGGNAGQAIAEAVVSLRAEQSHHAIADHELFRRALARSSAQLVSFLVNAAKGTPIASFIGAPELLSALTDITSFSTGRVTTYWLLLIFYILVVMLVVCLCGRLQRWLERSYAA